MSFSVTDLSGCHAANPCNEVRAGAIEGTAIATLRRAVRIPLLAVGLSVMIAGGVRAQPAPEQPADAPEVGQVTVTGRVIDALGRPVRGAKVGVEGSTVQITTDRAGRFRLSAPVGATLVVESSRFQTGLATVTGDALEDIVLLTVAQSGETIEVSGEAPPAAPGAASLDRQELQRVPGTGGDIVRALTVMPGVVNLQIPLGYSGVVIRGASPQDSKVLIDDFEVPVLFHNVGFRAIVPAEAIATLDFIPGGFDVAYGRASSGIVNLTTRAGADKRTEQAEVSFIDGGLIAQGPAGDDTHYMLALRRSTIDFVLPALIPDSVDLSLTTVPRYWDEQVRLDHKLSSRWNLTFSNLGTDDIFELVASKNEDAKDKRFFNRTRFVRNTIAGRYHQGPWTANVALSSLLQEFTFEIGSNQFIKSRLATVTPRIEVTRTTAKAAGLTDVVWRTGAESQIGRTSIDLALPSEMREGEPMPEFDPKDTSTRFTGAIWTPDFTAWTAVTANLDPKIRATTGVRAEVFGRAGEFALQPRGEIQAKLAKPWTLRLAAGGYRRPPQFQSENLTKDLGSERSLQTIAGVQYEPREGVRVQGSLYYTDRTKLITREADGTLGNRGRGSSMGGELLATYRGGPWFTWLSYSYSHSTRVDTPGAPSRLFTYDQPHSLNAAASWKRGKWQLGGRFQLYSGLPYTPPIGAVFDSDRNIYVPLYGEVNGARAPIHHQLDLRVDHTWKIGAMELTGFIDVQNVYMNTSVVTYFYSYDYSQSSAFESLPIIPSLGLRGVL
ncbi:MAG: TonB-dependent receptor [Deltaproteobacteria bacterium]|nr:TonB-dependent receptor [Deltaproteobacteria bacterium]